MSGLSFSEADHARVRDAIAAAEGETSGEIFAVFAQASDSYATASAAFALGLSLAAGLFAALLAFALGLSFPALSLEIAQALCALALLALLRLVPPLRMLFVPRRVMADRARRLALEQFMAHNVHATGARTGVLVFVSQAERHAEIVADAAIDAKVPQEEWDAIVAGLVQAARADRLADGFVAAIAQAGRLLATHFPKGAADANELQDRLVEI